MDRHVVTTVAKAKVVRGLVERLITYAKKGDLAARRQAARFIKDPAVLQGLFSDLGKRYAKRQGGYTRLLKLGQVRRGDSAQQAFIALVEEEISPRKPKKAAKARATKVAGKKSAKKLNITKSETKEAAPAAQEEPKPAAEA
jgi:large subunit ribosomal protein L17